MIKRTLITTLLFLAALAVAGPAAWAQSTFSTDVIIQGYTYTDDNENKYIYAISGTGIQSEVKGPYKGTEMHFLSSASISNFTFERGIKMSLEGSLAFANGSSLTDVTTTQGLFQIVFSSTQYYFARVRIATTAGADVSDLSVSGWLHFTQRNAPSAASRRATLTTARSARSLLSPSRTGRCARTWTIP